MEKREFISYCLWSLSAIVFGACLTDFSVKTAGLAYEKLWLRNESSVVFARNDILDSALMASAAVTLDNDRQERKTNRVSLVFVGDIMLDRGVAASVQKNGGGIFSFIFENAHFLKNADITFGNLEGPLSDIGVDKQNLYSFRMATSSFEALREAGFDALSVANNHAGDWGREAFEDTLFRLRNEEILAVGGGWNEEDAEKTKIIEKNGIKFGFLGFTDVGPNWLEATKDLSGILTVKEGHLDIIKKAASEVNYLIVSLHFGNEYQIEPSERQRYVSEAIINSGAKIVIGHHSHVAQLVENYHGGIIAYSLGNFVFDQYFSQETMQGTALKIIVDENGIIETSEKPVKLNNFYQPSLER